MKRPQLDEIDVTEITFDGGLIMTMSEGQWDHLLAATYQDGHTLLELDKHEVPIRAYRRG